jgi:hypothetical protein
MKICLATLEGYLGEMYGAKGPYQKTQQAEYSLKGKELSMGSYVSGIFQCNDPS